jgi:hypothetical protein
MAKLLVLRSQAKFDIAQTCLMSNLGEKQCMNLLGLVVFVISHYEKT